LQKDLPAPVKYQRKDNVKVNLRLFSNLKPLNIQALFSYLRLIMGEEKDQLKELLNPISQQMADTKKFYSFSFRKKFFSWVKL